MSNHNLDFWDSLSDFFFALAMIPVVLAIALWLAWPVLMAAIWARVPEWMKPVLLWLRDVSESAAI